MGYYSGKKVLVTGGCGFIGQNLVRRLVAEEANVTVLDDMFTGDPLAFNDIDDVFIYHESVNNKDFVMPIVANSDIVFHLAARNIIASTKDPLDDYETNIGGTLNILVSARHRQRIVYTSSASVYGNPRYLPINEDDNINLLTPYAVSKYSGEGYCMAFHESYNTNVTVLRLSNVYGAYQSPKNPYCGVVAKFFDAMRHKDQIQIHGDGLSTRDFTHVNDVVNALLIAGISPKAEGEIFNVATGIETSIEKLAIMISMLFEYDKETPGVRYVERRDIDNIRRRVLNIEKIRRKLDWMPEITLAKGLSMTMQWMQNN